MAASARVPVHHAARSRFTRERLAQIYRTAFAKPGSERLFLSSLAFFLAFLVVRGITISIHANLGPFRNVTVGGTHIHHLVWGIFLLLFCGLGLLALGGPGARWFHSCSRLLAVGFGVGAALTLDEFELWLHLADLYWAPQGSGSIRAVLLFGSLLSVAGWGWPLTRLLLKEVAHSFRGEPAPSARHLSPP
ncbi:MAG: hypothetical protein ACR2MZ_00880 [Candidatus Dormibacter sp.]|uniref:hypothetical protein n=1 Tax=Candidatus Dormibacter sp. TaxID=2973982 RepID=UPI000DB070BA|nr:MAG: hypothetical protein DLM66_04280 [Candidatus Dormibacteraeota bacterium]